MKLIRTAVLLGLTLLGCAPAWAQSSTSAVLSAITTNYPDNTRGAITPALRRTTLSLIANSYLNLVSGGTVTGDLVNNLNSAGAPASAGGSVFQLVAADSVVARFEADSFGAIAAFTARRANGTNASKTALASGDQIGAFNWHGYYVTGGPAYSGVQASVQAFANQNWTSTALGTKVVIATTPNGSTTLTTAATFNSDQSLSVVGGVTSGSFLALSGTSYVSWGSRAQLTSPADGTVLIQLNAGGGPAILQFGCSTASCAQLTNNGTTLAVQLANGLSRAPLTAASFNGLNLTDTLGSLTIANNASAGLSTSGNFVLTLTATATSNSTFPAGTHTLAALDLASQSISGGAVITSLSQSTGSLSVDCGQRPLQYVTNNGAWTVTAPSSDGFCMILVTNGASAATPTFSGFTVSSATGDALTNTNGSKFILSIIRINSVSTYTIKALQ